MAQLTLHTLICNDQQEDSGPDEPFLLIGGNRINLDSMRTGDAKSINHAPFPFSGQITVILREKDWPDSDDHLWDYVINETDIGGVQPKRQSKSDGDADYTLEYSVTA